MTNRKFILLIIFLGLIPLSCFRTKYPHYEIKSLLLELYKDQAFSKKINNTDTLSNDSVFIKLNVSINFISQNTCLDITNNIMATTKPQNGGQGLKDEIKEINFSSNNTFNNRQPNSNLNDLVKFVVYKTHKDLWELVGYLNGRSPIGYPNKDAQIMLYLTQRPNDSLRQNFNIEFIYKNGDIKTGQVSANWK